MRLQNDIIGKEILNDKGNIIGKVKDIEIDISTKKITFLIYSSENKSGFSIRKEKTEEEKIPFEEIGSIGDKIILKKDYEDMLFS